MKSFFDAGIITDPMVYRHPSPHNKASYMDWYPKGTHKLTTRNFTGPIVDQFINNIDILLCFETPFDWNFANRCQAAGVKTVIIPMYEWYPINPTHLFDQFINPSALDQEYFPTGTHIPIPITGTTWTLRSHAMKFLHNAGHIGSRGHKGTLELLQAMPFVQSPIELTVRCQYSSGMNELLKSVPSTLTDKRITIVNEEVPYESLFDDHDVYIAPEKFNGLSLPLQEAWAAGMMVMTTDRFPTNTWLPKDCLIPARGSHTTSVGSGYLKFKESEVHPMDIAATIDQWYGTNIEQYSISGGIYGVNNAWCMLKDQYTTLLESLIS